MLFFKFGSLWTYLMIGVCVCIAMVSTRTSPTACFTVTWKYWTQNQTYCVSDHRTCTDWLFIKWMKHFRVMLDLLHPLCTANWKILFVAWTQASTWASCTHPALPGCAGMKFGFWFCNEENRSWAGLSLSPRSAIQKLKKRHFSIFKFISPFLQQ